MDKDSVCWQIKSSHWPESSGFRASINSARLSRFRALFLIATLSVLDIIEDLFEIKVNSSSSY